MHLNPRHYVYRHIRNDNGDVFYVGKGSNRINRPPSFERLRIPHNNPHWQRIADNHGFEAEIMILCETDAEAQKKEKEFISLYGRRDLGRGTLVNFTDGGEGHCGIIVSPELRQKRSLNSSGPRSGAWLAAIRKSRKGGGNGGVVEKGDKLPQWWRDRISLAVRGSKNHCFGKTPKHLAKPVISSAGDRFPSIMAAAKSIGISFQHLSDQLLGKRRNTSGFSYE